MARKTIVLSAAFFLAACATTSPVYAKDPIPGVAHSLRTFLLVFGNLRPERQDLGSAAYPVMPVDYSYDHLVDQP